MQRLVPGSAWGCCWFKFEFCGLGVFCWDTGGCEKLCWGCCWKLLLGLCTTFMGLWDSGCWLKFCGRPPWPNSKSFQFFFYSAPIYSKTRTYEIGGLAAPAAAEAEEETRSDSPAAFGRWKHQDLANGPSQYKHWQLFIRGILCFMSYLENSELQSCLQLLELQSILLQPAQQIRLHGIQLFGLWRPTHCELTLHLKILQ